MSNMTPRNPLLSLFLILIKSLIEFLNLRDNSMYVINVFNGLKAEILTYSASNDSGNQLSPWLIEWLILY